MDKDLDAIIEKHLAEDVEVIDEAGGFADSEISSLVTGLKRIEYRLSKANTPQRFQDVFNMISTLVNNFPLKTKIIWKTVADAYPIRYGADIATSAPVERLQRVKPIGDDWFKDL